MEESAKGEPGGMITKQQRKALVFIEAEMERSGGVAPSVREIVRIYYGRHGAPVASWASRAWLHPWLGGKGQGIKMLKP